MAQKCEIKRENPLKESEQRTEKWIHASISLGVSGLGSLLVMDSCFGLLSSHKLGINDIALKMRFKPNILKWSVCVFFFFFVVLEVTRFLLRLVTKFVNFAQQWRQKSNFFLAKPYGFHYHGLFGLRKINFINAKVCIFFKFKKLIASKNASRKIMTN